MLFERRGNGEAQCVHNATVVRSHSAVLVAVEIEWARRLSGGRKLRSPREILGNKRVVMVLLYYYYAGWVDASVLSIAARGTGGDLVAEEEEEGCVMRQKDGLREALHKSWMQTTAWQEAVIRLSAGAGEGTAVVYNQGWMVACA